MKKGFFILVFMLFCFSAVFAVEFNIPLKNFEVKGISVDRIVVNTETNEASFFVTAPESYINDFNDIKLEALSRFYLNTLVSLNVDFRHLRVFLRTDETGEYKRATEFLPKEPPVITKEEEENGGVPLKTKKTRSLSPQVRHGNITGALSGKTIFVSAGHGWTYDTSKSKWDTQRYLSQGMREDDSNAEIVSYFLIPYLQNAGALVFSARERDRQGKMVIIDDADGTNYAASDGIYEESGSWTKNTTDSFGGYGRTTYPIERNFNPLKNGRFREATATSGTWARWTANIPEDGFYHVYVSYRRLEENTDSALYTVRHAGGTSYVTVNQQHHGSTWIDIGRYYFRAGLSRENGSVTLSGTSGKIVADAVRFGGGDSVITRNGQVSGKPHWEESAVHNIQFIGGTYGNTYGVMSNDRNDDIKARSRWAAWETEPSDDALYIAFHSNAPNSATDDITSGLSTYIYSATLNSGEGYQSGDEYPGSDKLAEFVHNRILSAGKTFYSSYKPYGSTGNNGIYSADLGEINKNVNNKMPSIIVELAFHTSKTDAPMLRNPKFRDIVSRAAYQAIVQYFYGKKDAVFLPGSPSNLRTKTNENGSVTLYWDAPESDDIPENYDDGYLGGQATGYFVQTSADGIAFNDGENVGNVLEWTGNFEPNKPVYFRVVAYNDGGVSFPSAVAAAVPVKTGAQVLVVDGFERIDNAMPRFNEGDSANHRYMLEYINSFDYVKYYAPLLAELGYSLDFTQRTNVAEMDLSKYDMIVWFLGEQSTENETFNHEEQEKIAEYIDDGGTLFVSGAEIGWDLEKKGDTSDKAFFNETLNAKYVADESKVYTFFGIDDFSVVSGGFDDGTYIYQAEYADVLAPFDENSGKTVLYYDNAMMLGAGILTKTDTQKVFVMGFPFETILEKDKKISILQTVMNEFEITPKVVDDDPADSGTETPDEDSDSDSADSDSDDTPDEDTSETEDEQSDEDTADTGDEKNDEDSADSTDTTDTSDSSDPSDPADTTDTSDSSDTADSSDPTDISDSSDSADSTDSSDSDGQDISDESDSKESSSGDSSESGKGGGCSLSVI